MKSYKHSKHLKKTLGKKGGIKALEFISDPLRKSLMQMYDKVFSNLQNPENLRFFFLARRDIWGSAAWPKSREETSGTEHYNFVNSLFQINFDLFLSNYF